MPIDKRPLRLAGISLILVCSTIVILLLWFTVTGRFWYYINKESLERVVALRGATEGNVRRTLGQPALVLKQRQEAYQYKGRVVFVEGFPYRRRSITGKMLVYYIKGTVVNIYVGKDGQVEEIRYGSG